MRSKFTRREFAAAMLMAPLGSAVLRGQQIDTGTTVGMRAVKIAVPEFKPSTADAKIIQLAKVFNDTLWNDLDFSGNLVLASKSYYPLGNFANPSDIRPDDWMKTGVEASYITYGSVAIPTTGSMRGAFTADLHFTELKSNQSPLQPVRWSGGLDTDEAARFVAHSWASAILESLGFGKGVSTTKIAYVSERSGAKEIYIMDYDGYGAFPLTSHRDLALTPAWSPDGEQIAFMGYRGSVTNIEVISRRGGSAVPFPSPAGLNTTPAWSPDGKRIAFASNRDKHGSADGPEIYIANSNGTNMIRLLPRPTARGIDTSPVWNPKTGRELAFVSDRSGSQQIYRINDDGTNLRRLIEDGGDAENPSWSPDGNFLAFAWKRSGSGRFDIYLHDLVTGRNAQLTRDNSDNEKPTWSPDGKHIAFESNRTGRLQIFAMLANGDKQRQLTKSGNENKAPAWSGYIK